MSNAASKNMVAEQCHPKEWLEKGDRELALSYIKEIGEEIKALQSDISTLRKWRAYTRKLLKTK